jgi:predicted nucleic acid-binding Zn ribbon protein
VNKHCPTCGRPMPGDGTYLGTVKFCVEECVNEWHRRHDRRKRSVPVKVERRTP